MSSSLNETKYDGELSRLIQIWSSLLCSKLPIKESPVRRIEISMQKKGGRPRFAFEEKRRSSRAHKLRRGKGGRTQLVVTQNDGFIIYRLFRCLDKKSCPSLPLFPSLYSFSVPLTPRGDTNSSSSPGSAPIFARGVFENGVLSPFVGDWISCCKFLNDADEPSSPSSSASPPRKEARCFISPRSLSGNFCTSDSLLSPFFCMIRCTLVIFAEGDAFAAGNSR